jgi:hypothetical protein
MTYTPPEPIKPEHDLETFDCGEPTLNDWLRKRALENETKRRVHTLSAAGRR